MRGTALNLHQFIADAMRGCPNQPLNLVGYSHGGNVILHYLYQTWAYFATNVVTLGTPARDDFYSDQRVRRNYRNFCAVSLDNDGVQFGGAHPNQLAAYSFLTSWSFAFRSLAFAYLRSWDFGAYFYYYELHIAAQTYAAWVMDQTRYQAGARNFVYNGGLFPSRDAHTAVREVDVWRRATGERGWNCR